MESPAELKMSPSPRPTGQAFRWLLVLGSFFLTSYGLANWLASRQNGVISIVYDWEKHIPFFAWSIIPYWIIDLLYAASPFVCKTKDELNTHAKRLLSAQIIAVLIFILFPLKFAFNRPPMEGLSGLLFDIRLGLDQPFNQAPSLHIVFLVILWVLYIRHLPGILLWPFHILILSIGVSVLTTFQHHFIDIPTGILLGWLCVWMWPDDGMTPLKKAVHKYHHPKNLRIAAYYALSAAILIAISLIKGNIFLWLIWPAVSLLLISFFYAWTGSQGFQKQKNGKINPAVHWLLFPYLLGVKINSMTRNIRADPGFHIQDGIWIGRFPGVRDISEGNYKAIIDMTSEHSAPVLGIPWHSVPCLNLLPPLQDDLMHTANLIESLQNQGPVLVACSTGRYHSAMAAAAWLVTSGRAENTEKAVTMLQRLRPSFSFNSRDLDIINGAIDARGLNGGMKIKQ